MPQVRRPALGNFDGFFGNKKRKTGLSPFFLPFALPIPPSASGSGPCIQFFAVPCCLPFF